jgi:hypothetical protein
MTLPKKKDEELTTADIAGGPSASPRERDIEAGKSVRSEGPGRADAPRPQLVNSPVITPPAGEKRAERERRTNEDPSASAPSANQAADVGRPAGAQKAPEASKSSEGTAALFSGDETHDLQGRWEKIQIAFVDEPRKAVEQADSLVATTISRGSGGVATTSPPRIYGWPCSAIGHSFSACCPSDIERAAWGRYTRPHFFLLRAEIQFCPVLRRVV